MSIDRIISFQFPALLRSYTCYFAFFAVLLQGFFRLRAGENGRSVSECPGLVQHQVTWSGEDFNGAKVASGIYVYRLKSADFTLTKKLTLIG